MISSKKYLLLLVSFVGFLFLFGSCKKYPENDRIYLSRVNHRLVKPTWLFKRLLIDGNDSTLTHLSRFSGSTDPASVGFVLQPFFNSDGTTMKLFIPNLGYHLSVNFRISKDKKSVLIGPEVGPAPNSFFTTNSVWDIKKLTKTDFIIQTNYNNRVIRFEFRK